MFGKVALPVLFLLVAACCMAEDIFAPTMVTVAVERGHRLGHCGVSSNAYRSAAHSAQGVRPYSVLPGIGGATQTRSSSCGYAFGGGGGFSGGSSFGAAKRMNGGSISTTYMNGGVSAPFADAAVGGSVGQSAPCRVPAGPPIGQLVPLFGELTALLACVSVYAVALALRRRRKSAPSAQK